MATNGGVVSRSACQGLLWTVARPTSRSHMPIVRKPRWISGVEQARSGQRYSSRSIDVRAKDEWPLQQFGKPRMTKVIIDQKSIRACKKPVRLVDSKIECLCSWNEASGSRQAIYVPGDASRPTKPTDSLSLYHPPTHKTLAAAPADRLMGYCNPGRGPRGGAWDDCLAALYTTNPELKLDHVDVMISDEVLLYILLVAQNGRAPFFGEPIGSISTLAFDLLLVGNTLVMKRRRNKYRRLTNTTTVPSNLPTLHWEYYKVATEPVPEVEDSSVHQQLLRYNIGPLSCLVKVKVNGTVQEMPTSTSPSEPPQQRDLHGIDVIKAGQGVHPNSAFQAIARRPAADPAIDARRLKFMTARLWYSGQTRLGIADVVPAHQVGELGGLTVIDMADMVRNYEKVNQRGLRRVAGLIMALRDAVRAHGGPCVGTFVPPPDTAGSSTVKRNYAIQVHGAGPYEAPVLLDWHKEHFWSQNAVPPDQVGDEHVHAPKGFIRKWAQWLGF